MKVFNTDVLERCQKEGVSPKIIIIKNFIGENDRGKLTKYGLEMFKFGISPKEVLYISLFDKPTKKFGIGELREVVKELESLVKVVGCNVLVDDTFKLDKDKLSKGLIFKDILTLDSNKWKDLGVLKASLLTKDFNIKMVCGLRWESISREKDSKDIIDREFLVKDEEDLEFIEVDTLTKLKDMYEYLKDKKEIMLDIETNMLDFAHKGAKILSIQLGCIENDKRAYLIWYDKSGIDLGNKFKNKVKQVMQYFMKRKPLVAHNGSAFDIPWLCLHMEVNPWEVEIIDTLVLGYLAYNSTRRISLGLKDLSYKYVGEYDAPLDVFKKQYCKENKIKKDEFSYDYIPKDILAKYSFYDIIALIPLRKDLQKACENHIGGDLYKESFLPFYKDFSKLISYMEVIGIPFNIKKAKELLNEKYKERKRIYSNIFENGKVKEAVNFINNKNYKKAMEQYNKKVQDKLQQGEEFKGKKPDKALGKYGSINFNVEFNPNSTDHKRVLFLEVLGLKPLKETSAGLVSVDSETCIKWAEENPKIDILNYFSKVAKLEKEITSFYEPYIRKSENSIDGRIRGFYRISGTISGRISMTDVNILQVPRDSDFKYFLGYPEDSEYFVIGDDITNLEGNQLTLISKDEALMKIREEAEGDGHSWLGINLANLGIELFKDIKGLDNSKLEDIKYVKKNYPNLRHIAKTANFSCIFGISGMGLARDLGIPKTDGEAIVDGFWETHKQAKEFFDSRELKAKKEGYVDLIGGAKLLTPDANHSDIKIQSKSIKSSNNATIQSGSWITHRAMINICNIAYEKGWDLKPLTPWHDACYFQCHKDILFEASQVIQKEMERPFMENQIYNLEGLPELGKSLKGGCELKGTLEEKLEIYNKFKKDNKIE